LTALVGVVGSAPAGAVEQTAVINFESGLSAGDIVSTLSVGNGISGADLGTVGVFGTNPDLAGNAAMIYDSTCGGQTVPFDDPAFDPALCTGDDDWDIYFPSLGNTLIITEDFDASDPDDEANMVSFWTFDFSDWGPGVVTVDQLAVGDVDEIQTGEVTLFDGGGTLIATVPLPTSPDDVFDVVPIGIGGVGSMIVDLGGSGIVDNISITADSPLIDLELTKDVAPAAVLVGEQTTFTVSVVNQGPDIATGVVVTDTLPAGLTYVSDNAGGAFDSATGAWTIGTLGVGATAVMEFVVTVDAAGTFTNVAEVTAANEEDVDSTPGNGTDNDEDDWDDATVIATVPPPEIDVELTKDVAPAAVQVGDETTFTVSVLNRGPDPATGVVVADTLPAGLAYVSHSGAGSFDSSTFIWTIGDLAVDESVSLSFVVTVDEVGSFTNVAEVIEHNEEDVDSTPGNGTDNDEDDWDDATVIATEEPPQPIDVELTKVVDKPAPEFTVDIDEVATFTVTVINKGPADATGVVVTDTLPAGLSYVSHSGDGSFDSTSLVWTIGDIPVDGEATLVLVTQADDVGEYTNVAEVTAHNEEDVDSTPGNGTDNDEDDWDQATIVVVDVRASSTIGDFVWFDDNADGIQDPDEDGVPNVTVRLTNQATNEVSTQVTNANGLYLFSALDAGTYLVQVLTSTFPDNYGLTTVGSYTVTLQDDESFLDADFGIVTVLPITGLELESFALIGLALLALGGGLLAVERRRRFALLDT
jgi:uncharacterized repeat protein (TIGR01451 family)